MSPVPGHSGRQGPRRTIFRRGLFCATDISPEIEARLIENRRRKPYPQCCCGISHIDRTGRRHILLIHRQARQIVTPDWGSYAGTFAAEPMFSPFWEFTVPSKSLWMDIDVMPAAGALDGDANCDVAVVGSGIAGISTAYELSQRGRSVIVIDRKRIAGGMTSRTSAHLAPLCDDLMSEFRKIRGPEAARRFYESQAAAVDRIEAIQGAEGIDCDFRRLDGYLFQGRHMPADVIDQELEAVREVGAPVHRLVGVPLQGCEGRHVLRYPRQAAFHPLKYLAGVAKVCHGRGVTFYADSPVVEIAEANGGVAVKTARGTIRAAHAVVATNSSISDRFAIHTKTAPYRTYVVAFELPRDALPDALYWDTEDPYHYVRLQRGTGRTDFLLV